MTSTHDGAWKEKPEVHTKAARVRQCTRGIQATFEADAGRPQVQSQPGQHRNPVSKTKAKRTQNSPKPQEKNKTTKEQGTIWISITRFQHPDTEKISDQ